MINELQIIKIQDEIGSLYNLVSKAEKQISPEKDPNWLRLQLTDLAQKSKIKINSLEPLRTENFSHYTYTTFRMSTNCTYLDLLNFVNNIESCEKLLIIESLNLSSHDIKLQFYSEDELEKTIAKVELVIATIY